MAREALGPSQPQPFTRTLPAALAHLARLLQARVTEKSRAMLSLEQSQQTAPPPPHHQPPPLLLLPPQGNTTGQASSPLAGKARNPPAIQAARQNSD